MEPTTETKVAAEVVAVEAAAEVVAVEEVAEAVAEVVAQE